MLCVDLNTSWKQHPTKQQLYRHLPLEKNTLGKGMNPLILPPAMGK